MTEQFIAIRRKNPVTKEMRNYIQKNGTTILKLSSFEDCKDVATVLNTYVQEQQLMNEFNQSNCITVQKSKIKELEKENGQLKNRVDELEDDNMKYTLSTDKLEGYTKRFMPTKCINEFRDCKTNRYYLLDNEDNFTGALELLNLLDCENEKLKSENRQLKGDNK